jgi:uncharacterized membrane protein YeaQ/YmgE (transglycosylase-associated protein family)
MTGLLLFAAFGCLAGGIAARLYPGEKPLGWLPTIGLGVVGSVVGGVPFGEGPAGLVGSVIGSVVVLYGVRKWSESNG